ncbi:MAG TPA: Rieske 2Fe-2S domain-containing protein [Candidatus Eisenbacteria bacterium]|nr:Rieske 2Fe-2S domain-containing protein [Candidatus Eisenbacteria bacterium]
MAEFHRVAASGDVVEGRGTIVAVNELKIALFRVEGTVYAIRNQCAHMGGSLGEGSIEGDVVRCPDHGWPFNVKTGQHPQAPVVGVRTFRVKEEGGEIHVEV